MGQKHQSAVHSGIGCFHIPIPRLSLSTPHHITPSLSLSPRHTTSQVTLSPLPPLLPSLPQFPASPLPRDTELRPLATPSSHQHRHTGPRPPLVTHSNHLLEVRYVLMNIHWLGGGGGGGGSPQYTCSSGHLWLMDLWL